MRFFKGERGASAVEFALILSLLFIVLFGIIQFGIAYNRYQGLQAAAREGARVASIGATQSEIQTRVRQAQSLFAGTDIVLSYDISTDSGNTWSAAANDPPCKANLDNLVRVTAKVPPPAGVRANVYAILIPLWGNARITYTAQGVFRCDQNG